MATASNTRQSAAESTLQFDWLLGDRHWFTFKELEHLTGMSDSFIEKLWNDHEHETHVSGHKYNAASGSRNSKRVARAFVVRLLVKTAQHTSEEKLQAYLSCLREFPREQLLQIAQEAYARAAQARQ